MEQLMGAGMNMQIGGPTRDCVGRFDGDAPRGALDLATLKSKAALTMAQLHPPLQTRV